MSVRFGMVRRKGPGRTGVDCRKELGADGIGLSRWFRVGPARHVAKTRSGVDCRKGTAGLGMVRRKGAGGRGYAWSGVSRWFG